jgi:hypothetical protein
MNPYVFFVGCPRSGTTLLGRIGDAHPWLAVIHETRWIPRCFQWREGLTREGLVTNGLVTPLLDPRALKPFHINESEMAELVRKSDGVHFASFVTRLFDLYGERQGKPLVADKSPGYVRYLPMLHELWPEAKFVHIIRDGRDVCLSVLDWRKGITSFPTFEEDPFTTAGVWWEWYVQLGREGGKTLGPGLYHELRYESLVADPEREAAKLCEFLGIPYDASMLRFHEGRTSSKRGLSSKSAWLPVTGGLRDWRTTMDADNVLLFEAAATDLLDELGYPRGPASTSRKQRERAARIRERFAEQARLRQRPVPRAWSNATVTASNSSPVEAGSG